MTAAFCLSAAWLSFRAISFALDLPRHRFLWRAESPRSGRKATALFIVFMLAMTLILGPVALLRRILRMLPANRRAVLSVAVKMDPCRRCGHAFTRHFYGHSPCNHSCVDSCSVDPPRHQTECCPCPCYEGEIPAETKELI